MRDRRQKRVKPGWSNYKKLIGNLFLTLNSNDSDATCRALALTNWKDIRASDAIALLAPLSTHPIAEVRQLAALHLASIAGSGDDLRALQALVTLASDEDAAVRTAAAKSSYIAKEFNLTPGTESAKSIAEQFVDWHHEGEITTFSFTCPDVSTAKHFLAIVAGLSATQMIQRSHEQPVERPSIKHDSSVRVPDLLLDDNEQSELIDLPRPGVPKYVHNVSRSANRLPELLIDE